jgi:hypothetical protein
MNTFDVGFIVGMALGVPIGLVLGYIVIPFVVDTWRSVARGRS